MSIPNFKSNEDWGDFECPPCNDLACADHLTDE